MPRFYEPDLSGDPNSPFVRDAANKFRAYWMDMTDSTLVMVMTNGIGANLTNDEKRAHLSDLKREHLVDRVCTQEILPPEKHWTSPNACFGPSEFIFARPLGPSALTIMLTDRATHLLSPVPRHATDVRFWGCGGHRRRLRSLRKRGRRMWVGQQWLAHFAFTFVGRRASAVSWGPPHWP